MSCQNRDFMLLAVLFAGCAVILSCGGQSGGTLSGELMVWHPVTLSITGPQASEDGAMNPFLDCRLDVVFSYGERSYKVPGYFAADGNAAETGAAAGTVWQVRFTPDEPGEWRYTAMFREGPDIALSENPGTAAETVAKGAFTVAPSDKSGHDFRGKGRLDYVGERYLRFAGSGGYFIKGGADSPENLLAFADFDGTEDHDSLDRENEAAGPEFIHTYEPHRNDWNEGDPVWRDGKGKAFVGMLNYLAAKGMNSVYFLTMNVEGDGKDVWPWTGYDERFRFDVSKLAQWEIVFSHMDKLGLAMHVITQETENDQLLDGGALGRERKLYYRELVARFGHHPALVWNLGEENTNTTEEQRAFADCLKMLDPYDHPVVIHTFPDEYDKVYQPLLGYPTIDGPSLQMGDPAKVHDETITWIDRSAEAGRQWVVCLDEIGPHTTGVKPDADDPEHNEVRHLSLWGNLMAGGAGAEWYFGYEYANDDLDCEDWRSRDIMWDQTRHALEFFQEYLPFTEMTHYDELTTAGDDYCFAKPGEVYAIYLPHGGTTELDLGDRGETFTVQWYNPRVGGALMSGSVTTVSGSGLQNIGLPPEDNGKDCVALVRSAK